MKTLITSLKTTMKTLTISEKNKSSFSKSTIQKELEKLLTLIKLWELIKAQIFKKLNKLID